MSEISLTLGYSSKGDKALNLDKVARYINGDFTYYAIFDGHGDDGKVSDWLKHNLHKYLFDNLSKGSGTIESRITTAFILANKAISLQFKNGGGSAAILLIKWQKRLYLINLGDSKGLALHTNNVILETVDHIASNPSEKTRILAAGGTISQSLWRSGPERLNGVLSITRGFGNADLVKSGFICEPDIYPIPKDTTSVVMFTHSYFEEVGNIQDVYPMLITWENVPLKHSDNLSLLWLGVSNSKTDDLSIIEFSEPKMINDSDQFPIANSMFFDDNLTKEQSVYLNWWMHKRLEEWIYVIQLIMVLTDMQIAGVQTVKFVVAVLYNSPWEDCVDVQPRAQPGAERSMQIGAIQSPVSNDHWNNMWTRISDKFESIINWRELNINEPGKKVLYHSCWILKETLIDESGDSLKDFIEDNHAKAALSYGKNGSEKAIRCFCNAFNNVYEKVYKYVEIRNKQESKQELNSLRISITTIRIIFPQFTVDQQIIEKLKSIEPIVTISELEILFGKGLITKIDSFGIVKGVTNLVLLSNAINQLFHMNNAEACLRVAQFNI